MLPKDFPKWRTCYEYFKKWSIKASAAEDSVLDIILKELVGVIRISHNRKLKATFMIIDAQSVKNTDIAKKKVTMRGRKYLV